MKLFEIRYGKKCVKINMPTSYEELTPKQFLAAMSLFENAAEDESAFWACFGIKPSLYDILPFWAKVEFRNAIGFLLQLDTSSDKFLLPSLRVKGRKLFAPCKRLAGMSLQQFMSADTFFSYYICTGYVDHLDKLTASLYLMPKEGFVIDETHSKLLNLDKRARLISKHMTKLEKFAIFTNWSLIKSWLSKEFQELFPKGGAGDDDKKKPQPADWLSLFDAFVGDNIPYTESYQKMECMDAFRILDKKIKEQKSISV